MKNICFLCFTFLFLIGVVPVFSSKCGCKTMHECYTNMLDSLRDQDEAYCTEDASIGTSTVMVFLQALEQFCGHLINVTLHTDLLTYDKRSLYEVVLYYEDEPEAGAAPVTPPTIVIDAGQEGGSESVGFALYIIEQLVGCEENFDMIDKVKWIIMPSTNPDGMEYSRFSDNGWTKNLRIDDDGVSYGVAIGRNFDEQWAACGANTNGFSSTYPGPIAGSEAETSFIKRILNKYKEHTKIYLSIRRNGHHIGYPYAYDAKEPAKVDNLAFVAAEVAAKVNLRSGGVNVFGNDTIYNLEGKAHCGHSVDYAYSLNIPLAFEMRVFLETDNQIMSMFQTMPRGYESSLRNGYISGVRELYSVITNEKKYGKILH